ncbi:MAG: ABC transporter permease [Hyphomicrobiaceae bacterium]
MTSATGFMVENRTLKAYAIMAVIYLYAPIVILLAFSFNNSIFIAFPFKGLTLKWYEAMAANTQLHKALWNSIVVGAIASVVATMIATLAAKAVTRHGMPGRHAMVSLVSLPMVMPEIILGIALLVLLFSLGVTLSLATIILGHIIVCTPYALVIMISRFQGYDPSYEEASLDLGEGALSTFWRVTLPLVWPGVASSLLLTFLISFDDFVVTFFVTGTEQTLPIFIWSQLRFADRLPGVLALGSLIIVASTVLLVIVEWLRRRGEGALRTM